MKAIITTIVGLALALPSTAQNRSTIYVDRMEGMEPFVEKALQDAKLGRSDTHSLQFWDVERHEVIASYEFTLTNSSDEGRRKAAEEFAKRVKEAVAKKRVG